MTVSLSGFLVCLLKHMILVACFVIPLIYTVYRWVIFGYLTPLSFHGPGPGRYLYSSVCGFTAEDSGLVTNMVFMLHYATPDDMLSKYKRWWLLGPADNARVMAACGSSYTIPNASRAQ